MWRRTVIDLTALLDVILILLFLVLMSANMSAEQLRAETAADEASIERLEAEKEALSQESERLSRALQSMSFLNEHTRMINVSVEANAQNDLRSVCVEPRQGEAKRFVLTWNNAQTVKNALRKELARLCVEEKTDERQLSLLIFRYDRASIYQMDYALVTEVIRQVKSMDGNIYSAEYDITEVGEDAS